MVVCLITIRLYVNHPLHLTTSSSETTPVLMHFHLFQLIQSSMYLSHMLLLVNLRKNLPCKHKLNISHSIREILVLLLLLTAKRTFNHYFMLTSSVLYYKIRLNQNQLITLPHKLPLTATALNMPGRSLDYYELRSEGAFRI